MFTYGFLVFCGPRDRISILITVLHDIGKHLKCFQNGIESSKRMPESPNNFTFMSAFAEIGKFKTLKCKNNLLLEKM